MQDHYSSSKHTKECIDLEVSSLSEEQSQHEEKQQIGHLSKPKVTITYSELKPLKRPTSDESVDAPPSNKANDSLTRLISRWTHLWSHLCLLGVLQCPSSGCGRLPWFLLRTVLAVTLLAQAVTSVRTLVALPHGAAFFVSLQACEHFSLLSLLLPALSFRANAFRRALALMSRLQTLEVFGDLRPAAAKRRMVFVMVVAGLVFVGLQGLHVIGGLITVEFRQRQTLPAKKFALFPIMITSDSLLIHYALVALQFVHVFSVYAANVLSVTTLHLINIFLYYHLDHLATTVRALLERSGTLANRTVRTSPGGSGENWSAQLDGETPNTRRWTEILEAHSLLWQLQGELQKTFGECGAVTHLAGLLDICLTSYICIRAYWQYELSWMVLAVAAGYMTFSGLCILFESMSTDCVQQANAAIFDSNYCRSLVGLRPQELDIARLIMMKAREPMQLNVMNMFDITMASFGSVLSLAVTYLIIIIQFDG
ncbi:uncharacterized protein LOC122372223 [Amphibalanus amphitrite]|uniref:uncharacterized protein LOC122372223 n=1 Tax=Amphibalanus amphitrite TaxID=1232801 RepID=UPI001C927BB1|nr:uncharacterized protein LOC122372223 [Amphibalanus amphitrite]